MVLQIMSRRSRASRPRQSVVTWILVAVALAAFTVALIVGLHPPH